MGIRIDPKALDEMERLFRAGTRAEAIAFRFAVDVRTVYRRLAARRLRYRRVARPAAQRDLEMRRGKIHLWLGQARRPDEMATLLGIRPRTFRAWLSRHMPELCARMKAEGQARRTAAGPRPRAQHENAERGPAPLTRARRRRIKQAYLLGYSTSAIARHYRHHPVTIWRLLQAMKVPLRPRTARSPRWIDAMREHHAGTRRQQTSSMGRECGEDSGTGSRLPDALESTR
jgi:DNA invertase Pin-like site-specific DNA recombinase